MQAKLWFSAILALAPVAYSQEPAPAPADAATAEAKRQGRVAMNPNAQSPVQSMSQAIAFERYKELAAQREARKEGMQSTAHRSAEKPKAGADGKKH